MKEGILIEPIINNIAHGFAIQATKFSFSLKITNNSTKPSQKFLIKNVTLFADGQNINDDFNKKEFSVEIINPTDSFVLNIGDNGQFMNGLIRVKADIIPSNIEIPINFLQKNSFTKEITFIGENRWIDFFYIKSLSEHRQEITNNTMIVLTSVLLALTILQIGKLFNSEITNFINVIMESFGNYNHNVSNQMVISLIAIFVPIIYWYKNKKLNLLP